MTAIFAMISHSKQETIAIARVFGKALILPLKMFKIQEMFHQLVHCNLYYVKGQFQSNDHFLSKVFFLYGGYKTIFLENVL